MSVDIKITGADEIIKAYDKAPAVVEQQMRRSIMQALILLQGSARMRTPVDTGRLRASERFEQKGSFEGRLYTDVKYAKFVHEGTRFMKARPFFKEAKEDKIKEVERIFEKAAESITRKLST